MSHQLSTLEKEYRKCAEAYGRAAVEGDAKVMNKNYNRLDAILAKLREYGKQGEDVLRRLMKDGSDAVATFAATDSLLFAETEGLKVLDAIARKNGPIPFDARMTARQWRAGQLKIQ